MHATLPALFVSHGAPTIALETDGPLARDLRAFVRSIPRPRAIAVASAHWQTEGPIRVTASPRPGTIHDFGGFPDELYRIRYPAPGDPALAARTVALLKKGGFDAEPEPRRGLDHGAWTPLVLARPEADIPVVEVSLPFGASPEELLRLGRALGPLRDEGVLLVGSGSAVHNLRRLDFREQGVAPWAEAFDRWLAERVEALDARALSNWQTEAPQARTAQPTSEHFDPVLVVVGAARPGERTRTIHAGFQLGSLSMRSFAVEPRLQA